MAVRGWGGSVATAIGVAAGAGAAQLGFGYGLGIITWAADTGTAPVAADPSGATWVASLAWSTWIAATSTVAGAVGAQRLGRRPGTDPGTHGPADADPGTHGPADADPAERGPADGVRRARRPAGALPIALAAALGALVTVLLVAVPARAATSFGITAPQDVAATYAGAGVLLGLLVAIWALRSPPAAVGIIATTGWVWLLAVVAVVDGVLAGRGLTSAQLGTWQLSADRAGFWWGDHLYWPGALLALGSALVIGALAARRAARSTYRRVGAAAAGAAGPILVAVAYLLVAPRLTEIRGAQLSAHLVAPYAVIAGFAGSALVAALAQRRDAMAALAQRKDAVAATTDRFTGAGPATTGATDPEDRAQASGGRTDADDTGPVPVTGPPVPGSSPPGSIEGPPLREYGSAAADAIPVEDPATPDAASGEESGTTGPARRRAGRSTARVPRPRRGTDATAADPEPTDVPDRSSVSGHPQTGDVPSDQGTGTIGTDPAAPGEPDGPDPETSVDLTPPTRRSSSRRPRS